MLEAMCKNLGKPYPMEDCVFKNRVFTFCVENADLN